MITNETQLRSTESHLRTFETAITNLAAKLEAEPSRLTELELSALRAQASDLRAECDEYRNLRSGRVVEFKGESLSEIATMLIKARIARGWTQRQLGEALRIAEQQVQRYEATGYRSASLARIGEVADALGVTFSEQAQLSETGAA